jgi:lysophospholipase L1-like esterase
VAVLAVVGWTVALLPMWMLRRTLGRHPMRVDPRTPGSGYVERASGRTPDSRVRRPGSLRAPESRLGSSRSSTRVVAVTCVTAALGLAAVLQLVGDTGGDPDATAGAVDLRGPSPSRSGVLDLRQRSSSDEKVRWAGLPVDDYAHADEPFAPELFRELVAATPRPDPLLGARLTDARGEHVNIVEGRRVTWQPDSVDVTVWYFGGSTMYGIGQRDDHTIPSVVAKLAHADGIGVQGLNFGVSADVNWIETLRFAEALDADLPAPDVVVFYDGSNDQGVGFERVDTGRTDPDESSRLALADEERAPIVGAQDLVRDAAQRAALAAELSALQYSRGVRTARALGAERGVPVVHFWQPQPFAMLPGPEDAELYRRVGFDPALLPAARSVYESIRDRSGVEPIDLSRAFDGVDEPVFFDGSHTNELGARIVAAAMYEQLRPLLIEATGR